MDIFTYTAYITKSNILPGGGGIIAQDIFTGGNIQG